MEIGALHAQGSGGAGDVPFGFIEGAEDVFALGGFFGFAKIAFGLGGSSGETNFYGDRLGGQDVASGQDGHALDCISQFTDIAGPVMIFQCLGYVAV